MPYLASDTRYNSMTYNRVGHSGLKLPAISLGWWYNFGGRDVLENGRAIARRAFDLGVTHFDLANNYGPPPGSAEDTFGQLYKQDFHPYRDELIISTKAGYDMWPGPYGEWGSRKYMLASLDAVPQAHGARLRGHFLQSSSRPRHAARRDDGRPRLGCTSGQGAICRHLFLQSGSDTARSRNPARNGNALSHPSTVIQYVRPLDRGRAIGCARRRGNRLYRLLALAQGQLTDRYLKGIPSNARASKTERVWLTPDDVKANLPKVKQFNELAKARGQSLAQMAVAWTLRKTAVTSALIGASSVQQLEDNLAALSNLKFSDEELNRIESILKD